MFQFLSRLTPNKYSLINSLSEFTHSLGGNNFSKVFPVANLSNVKAGNQKVNIGKISTFDSSSILQNIKNTLLKQERGRLFAIIHLCGKQFKITDGDIILVQGYWPPTVSDKIRLEKVLLVGANDFTLVGCPILEQNMCEVQATIIEKTLSHTKTHFRKKRRKQYQRINFYRSPHTMIRINSININSNFNVDDNIQKNNNLNIF